MPAKAQATDNQKNDNMKTKLSCKQASRKKRESAERQTKMQHESSITHRKHLSAGLTVTWERSTGNTDSDWSVVCYSDGTRWLFDNGGAQLLTLLGEVSDGLGKAEILESEIHTIVALYGAGPEAFPDREAWVQSLADCDKAEAEAIVETDRCGGQ